MHITYMVLKGDRLIMRNTLTLPPVPGLVAWDANIPFSIAFSAGTPQCIPTFRIFHHGHTSRATFSDTSLSQQISHPDYGLFQILCWLFRLGPFSYVVFHGPIITPPPPFLSFPRVCMKRAPCIQQVQFWNDFYPNLHRLFFKRLVVGSARSPTK